MSDTIIAIINTVIGASIVIGGDWIRTRLKLKENRYLLELDRLNKLDQQLSEYLKSGMYNIYSFNKSEIKGDVKNLYQDLDNSKIQELAQNVSEAYDSVILAYLRNRHLIMEDIRAECDEMYNKFGKLLSNFTRLTMEEKKMIVIYYYTLSAFMYFGVLKRMEYVSNKLYPLK